MFESFMQKFVRFIDPKLDKYRLPKTITKPQKYTPIPPKELTQRFKRKMNSTLEYLEKKLPNVKEDYNEPIHSITNYENVTEKIKEYF